MCGHNELDILTHEGMAVCGSCGHVQLHGQPLRKLVAEGKLDLSKPVKYYSGSTMSSVPLKPRAWPFDDNGLDAISRRHLEHGDDKP